MYQGEDSFESDLMNSFAYLTAVVFAQEFDDRPYQSTNFSQIVGYNDIEFSLHGTVVNTGAMNDVICNINDMSGNYGEYVTEFKTNNEYKCTRIGGFASGENYKTITRSGTKVTDVLMGM